LELEEKRGHLAGQGNACAALGEVHQILGELEKALEFYQRAKNVLEEMKAPAAVKASLLMNMASCLFELGKTAQAWSTCDQAASYLDAIPDIEERLELLERLAQCARTTQQFDRFIGYSEHMLEIFHSQNMAKEEFYALMSLGDCYRAAQDLPKAKDTWCRALPLADSQGRIKNKIACLHHIVSCCLIQGQYEEALTYLQQELEGHEKMLDVPRQAKTLTALGECHRQLGHQEDAIRFYQRALELEERTWGLEGQIRLHMHLGKYLAEIGKAMQGVPHIESALTLLRRRHPEDHPAIQEALSLLATMKAG
jgi:tetratricopeptide (TPR) repeat protein